METVTVKKGNTVNINGLDVTLTKDAEFEVEALSSDHAAELCHAHKIPAGVTVDPSSFQASFITEAEKAPLPTAKPPVASKPATKAAPKAKAPIKAKIAPKKKK